MRRGEGDNCVVTRGAVWCLRGEMEPTEVEKRQARRVQIFLYVLVAIMIVVPAVIFIVRLP